MDLAAITDHMKVSFAHKVSLASGYGDDAVVLPGMEVNFVPDGALGFAKIHLVVVMPRDTSLEGFSRLFQGQSDIPDTDKRSGHEEVTGISLKEWVARVHEEGGICIAAHVDSSKGIRRVFRQQSREVMKLWTDTPEIAEREDDVPGALREYIFSSGLNAIEVASFADKPHYRWVCAEDGVERSIATVRTFDAHCLEELNQPKRLTHIKMTDVGFDGLKEAIKFPDTRIRFDEDVPPDPIPFIRGIRIVGGEGAFFPSLTLGFAENLNCLIGARGSGKSSVVEALRYVFGYNRSLHKLQKGVAQQVKALQQAVLQDSLIHVVYKAADGGDVVLEATYDPKSDYATTVYSSDGYSVPVADVEACGRFPLRLFGWSEIEYLGRKPERQRDLLDLLIPEIAEKLRRRLEICAELETNRSDIEKVVRDLQIAIESSQGEINRFQEYVNDFKLLDTEDVKKLFEELDRTRVKRSLFNLVSKNAAARANEFGTLGVEPSSKHQQDEDEVDADESGSLCLTEGVEALLKKHIVLSEWWEKTAKVELGVGDAEIGVRSLLREIGEKVLGVQRKADDQSAAYDKAISSLEGELRDKLSDDADLQRTASLRKNAQDRLARVQALRTKYLEHWKRLESHRKSRKVILGRFVGVQEEISKCRAMNCSKNQKVLNGLLPQTMKIEIEISCGGDVDDYIKKVEPLLKTAVHYRHKKLSEKVAKKWTPTEFASFLWEGGLRNPGIPDSPLNADDREKITEDNLPYSKNEGAGVCVLHKRGERLIRLLKLQEAGQDDAVLIRLNGQPIDKVSPGQRASAMLPLIALAEKTPLVIDQPEDNLDKRLIGQALAKVLAELKEKRQIIVCTHDPNIVVGGDAEQVIVLEPESDKKGKVADNGHGAVDTPAIIKTIVDLLEGGKMAFETRKKRYGGWG